MEKPQRYVPHTDTEIWERLGWEFLDFLPPPLGGWAQLYCWPHESEPRLPEAEQREQNVKDWDEIFGGDGE
jgi:hypothetical protein